mgnify:CR=1 FL=1
MIEKPPKIPEINLKKEAGEVVTELDKKIAATQNIAAEILEGRDWSTDDSFAEIDIIEDDGTSSK